MKVVSFFSRFTLICNIAFLFFIFFSKMESQKPATEGSRDVVVRVPFIKDLIITLGFSAIVINLLMCLVYAIIVIVGKKYLLPNWLAMVNFGFLFLQIYFFFFR